MKKILIFLLVATVLLVSCSKKDKDETQNPDNSGLQDTPVEDKDDSGKYEKFEYSVTAREWSEVEALPLSLRAREFLSALCLKDEEALEMYVSGDSVKELLKAEIDAEIGEAEESIFDYGDFSHVVYIADVKLTINESKSDFLSQGTYYYSVCVTDASQLFVEYFGEKTRYEIFEGSKIPSADNSPAQYSAYTFIENLFHETSLFSEESLKNGIPTDTAFHAAVHDLMSTGENYTFALTLDEFKDYISLRYGYTEEKVLSDFAEKLSSASYAQCDENGVYTGSCAHGYSSLMKELTNVETNDDVTVFTYTLFADTAHIIPCAQVCFSMSKNENSNIMTLTDIEYKSLNELNFEVMSV